MRLLTISGSLREGSYNTALARAAADVAPEGVEVELFDGLGELPHFDADLEGDENPAVRHLRESIDDADAVFFVTPEYNGSIPGVLKNAVDWASRPRRRPSCSAGRHRLVDGTPSRRRSSARREWSRCTPG